MKFDIDKRVTIYSTAWKVSKYGVFFGPYFPVFSRNTGKYGPEITPYLDTFHAVLYIQQCWIFWGSIENRKSKVGSSQGMSKVTIWCRVISLPILPYIYISYFRLFNEFFIVRATVLDFKVHELLKRPVLLCNCLGEISFSNNENEIYWNKFFDK